MLWGFCFALFFLPLSLVSADCDSLGCQAFVWGYPLWSTVNHRYLSGLSPSFQYNNFAFRVSSLPIPGQLPQLATCNASICSGVPSIPFNPSPTNVPYRYFLYGAWTFDFGAINATYPGGAIEFVIPPKSQTRYGSLIIYDSQSSIVQEYYSINQPAGVPVVLCLAAYQPHPACASIPGPHWTLPRYGFGVLRGFTTGVAAPPCGYDGCLYILGAAQHFQVIYPPVNVTNDKVKYDPYMNQDACPYVYNEQPCGNDGDVDSFWNALCLALEDNPVSGAEAAYVEATFSSLGIHADGCDANLAYHQLKNAVRQGWKYINDNIGNTGVTQAGIWSFLPFSGNWNVQDLPSALLRANSVARVIYMNPNHATVYWHAFKDSNLAPLDGKHNTTYKLVWQSTDAVVDPTLGFWSVHLYNPFFYLYGPTDDQDQYSYISSAAPSQPIYFANDCTGITGICIRSPADSFNVLFRAYVYLPNVYPGGDYAFPAITKCPHNQVC